MTTALSKLANDFNAKQGLVQISGSFISNTVSTLKVPDFDLLLQWRIPKGNHFMKVRELELELELKFRPVTVYSRHCVDCRISIYCSIKQSEDF